jgi:hypothetical protein
MLRKLCLLKPFLLAPIVILFAACLASCTERSCTHIEDIAPTPLTSQWTQPVIEDSPTFIAIHGGGNAILNFGEGGDPNLGGARIIRIEQSVPIPRWAHRATVMLNGWRLGYSGNDHHVLGLGSLIAKIRAAQDPVTREYTLSWDAWGLLVDNAGREGYSLEYTFTVIGWNESNLNADVDHGDLFIDPRTNAEVYACLDGKTILDNYIWSTNDNTTTALASFFSFIQNIALAGSKTVALLPRGFGFGFNDDHHLLQMGYNLDHSEIFADSDRKYSKRYGQMNAPVPQQGVSHVDSGFVSWNTNAIFQDNERKDYTFVELVSAIGGNDVGVIQPPFSILPSKGDTSWIPQCGTVTGNPPVVTEEITIENIPFQYAIPMLTGWNLEYFCHDQRVKEVGIWIDGWSYEGAGGKLHYTLSSTLRDNGNWPQIHSHRVTILGFRPVGFK